MAWPIDPDRKILKLVERPARVRAAWAQAVASGGLFDDAGPAAHWRPATRRLAEADYGRWLGFLERRGLLTEGSPAERVTRETVAAYVALLRSNCLDTTVRIRVEGLARVLAATAPDSDWTWLRSIGRMLLRASRTRREKRSRLRPPRELLDFGLGLMAASELQTAKRPLRARALFRDGLIIALLAARPIRLRALTALALDGSFVRVADEYMLRLSEENTKTRVAYEAPLPTLLTPYADRYLFEHRPRL